MLNFLILYFFFSIIIFFLGIVGLIFAYKRSYFFVIISFETMFIAINLNFFVFSLLIDSILGLNFLFIIIIVSAVEVVIILSFIVLLFKKIFLFDSAYSFKSLKC